MADIKKKLVDGAGLQAAMGIMADYADKGVRGAIGGYNQSFPLTTATQGNIYYHKTTNRYYICINNYNGTSLTNPNSNFEELSAYTNRQKIKELGIIETKSNTYGTSYKYGNGLLVFKPIINAEIIEGTYPIPFENLYYAGGTFAANATILDEATYQYNAWRSITFTNNTKFKLFGKSLFGTTIDWHNLRGNTLNLVAVIGTWK